MESPTASKKLDRIPDRHHPVIWEAQSFTFYLLSLQKWMSPLLVMCVFLALCYAPYSCYQTVRMRVISEMSKVAEPAHNHGQT